MRSGIVLAALIFVATGAAADTYTFADMKHEFWRPAPGISLRFRRQTVTLSSPCFISDFSFENRDGQLSSNKPLDSETKGAGCTASRPSFDAIKSRLTRMTGYHVADGRLTLTEADGVTLTLEPIAPTGFEFRELAVSAFRWRGTSRRMKPLSIQPTDLVLYDGRIDGSIGYGGAYGTYESIGPSRYKIMLISVVTGTSENDARERKQAQHIIDAFNGVRDVDASGADFVLLDSRGREQIILSPLLEGEPP